jgi:hypothetical protein
MLADFLDCRDPRWQGFLASGPHDFYHLPAYVDLCARQEGGTAAAFWARQGDAAMLIPLVLRPLPPELEPQPGWRDTAAPYGYPCPLLRGGPDEAAVAGFLAAFRRAGAEAGIVCAFLRLHPLLELPPGPLQAQGTLVDHGQTVYLDLTRSRDDLDRQTRPNHLADVRRLQRQGFQVRLDRWELLDAFIEVYEATMRLREADAFYYFERPYYDELRRCLGRRLHLCTVQAPDGAMAAAGLFTEVDGLVQFHLSGTAEAHRRLGPAKLMLIHMRDWAQDRGARCLHLGGGVGCREDSLAFFKQGFSKQRARFLTLRMVLAPERYRALAERRGLDGTGDPAQFFPAYRQTAAPQPCARG